MTAEGMSPDRESFARLRLLVGETGIERLWSARVVVFGLGGVGSWAAEALVRGGVGHVLLVDDDVVRPSNLNRQLEALHSTLGVSKVEALSGRLRDISPQADIRGCAERLTPDNCADFLGQLPAWDYVVDAIDDRPAKIALLLACFHGRIPVISSMGAANKMAAAAVQVADLADSHGCPLARLLRKKLRQAGVPRGIRAVFSPEPPVRGPDGGPLAGDAEQPGIRRSLGTISYLPALFGLRCAAEVIQGLLVGAAAGASSGQASAATVGRDQN
ncbi:MAG: tRNA threonylcarbamoyladenosine dehydratase [Lentisphaeria bacterium]|nr:tRNA threonylcarbamoyladenosine dehydratase [Lentisphaeria bacterium]